MRIKGIGDGGMEEDENRLPGAYHNLSITWHYLEDISA